MARETGRVGPRSRFTTWPGILNFDRGRGGDRWGKADSEAHAEDNLESLDVTMLRLQAVFNRLAGQQ
jgi:hypothetical protein